jgi:hypothetical protein
VPRSFFSPPPSAQEPKQIDNNPTVMASVSVSTSSTDTASPAKVSDEQVRRLLSREYSTLRFRIEYGGYLSNHLLHGVVALHDLGASKHKIDDFAAHYAQKLEGEGPDHPDVMDQDGIASVLLSEEEARALLGQRSNYDALLGYYAHDVKTLGIDGAVRKSLPLLVGGLAGALLHGMIQLGYSYHIGGDRLVAEGLAYQHFSYLSFDEPPSGSAKEPLRQLTREEAFKVVDAVTSNEFLLSEQDRLVADAPLKDLDIGWIQRGVNALSGHPERGSAAAFALIWDTVHEYDFTHFDGSDALDLILWLYVMIKHNDFVVLHAVTSAWSIQQLEHLLSPSDRARGWRVWLHVTLSAIVTARVRDFHEEDVCVQAGGNVNANLETLPSWSQLREKAIALPGYPDEHVYKLVQVADAHAHAAYRGEGDANAPLLTQAERDLVARKAAIKVTELEFAPYSQAPK